MDPLEVVAPETDPQPPPRTSARAPRDVEEVGLRDGSRMWVRPIQPDDRERIEQGLRGLSPRSRYLRFHSHVDHLTKAQLDYLVDVDHHDHDALVALDPDLPGIPGIAVARYIRLAEDPAVAEAAITVIDDHQGRGIGTALIGMLERLAHERGIRTFRNYVLAENTPMLEIFRQLGGEVVHEGSGLFRVDVPVPGPDEDQPDTPAGRWVATIGRAEEERRTAWAYPLIWLLRRLGEVQDELLSAGESRLLKGRVHHPPEGAADPGPGDRPTRS